MLRVLVLVAGGGLVLWLMRTTPALAERVGWPTWLVALLVGLLVLGPLLVAGEAFERWLRLRRGVGRDPHQPEGP